MNIDDKGRFEQFLNMPERLKNPTNLSHNEQEQLERIKRIGSYSSTVHNDATKALESLIKKGYTIKRTIENKYIMVFTYEHN